MRTLPLIERVLLGFCLLLVVALLGFLAAWHVRFASLAAFLAAGPRPGEPALPPSPPPAPAGLAAEFRTWTVHVQDRAHPGWDMPEEIDRLRICVAATPAQAAPPSATAAALAGFIARGVRLDGAPIPPWQAPDEVYQHYIDAYGGAPSLDLGMEALTQEWLRDLARPGVGAARRAAALGDFDAAVAAMDQPASESAYQRWRRCLGARDAAYLLAALQRDADPALRARVAAWRAEPRAGIATLIEYHERFRMQVLPMYFLHSFAVLPPMGVNGMGGGIGSTLRAATRWWQMPSEARKPLWADVEDDLIARGKRSGQDQRTSWSPAGGKRWRPFTGALAIRADAAHRLAVLAATALAARGADGAFPADAAGCGLGASDLAGGGDLPPLTVRVDGRRLLIAIDRGATLAPYLAECFHPRVSTTAEDGTLPLSLTPEAVSIDVGDARVRAIIAGGAATAAAAAP